MDYAQLLKKCEAPRILAEISRILKMDYLSQRNPHNTTPVYTMFHNVLTAPLLYSDDPSSNGKFVTTHSSSPGVSSAPLPSNNDFLIASFTPREISQVMKLLQTHKCLLPKHLKLDLNNKQDYGKILSYSISKISSSTKYLFLPYYLPGASMFTLIITGSPPVPQLRTNQAIKLEPLSHISIQLNLQILSRSTYLQLHSSNNVFCPTIVV